MRLPPHWLALVLLVPVTLIYAADPPRRHEVVTPKNDAINAVAINSRGEVVGFEWAEDPEHPGVIGQEPFLYRGGVLTRLPLLPTYTSTMPAAISETGLVVGRSTKPINPQVRVPLQNQAFVWTEGDGIRGIGALPGDFASLASGVAADGATICGISIGDNRVRACVWERTGSGAATSWRGSPLPQTDPIASANVAISPDGRYLAGLDGGVPTLWSRSTPTSATWTRVTIGPISSFNPRAVNNTGTVAGIILPRDGSTHAAVWTELAGIKPIPEPDGYTRSEAVAINNAGSIVGMIDGAAGSPVSPHAFVFEDNQLRILVEAGPHCVGATAINDNGQVAGSFEKEETPEPIPAEAGTSPKP